MGEAYASDPLRRGRTAGRGEDPAGGLALDDELLRAIVMTLLATYFRARPGDTRFQKRALAAMPADRRDYASVNLGKIIEMARKLSERSDA
jgi:hypothetical protein